MEDVLIPTTIEFMDSDEFPIIESQHSGVGGPTFAIVKVEMWLEEEKGKAKMWSKEVKGNNMW